MYRLSYPVTQLKRFQFKDEGCAIPVLCFYISICRYYLRRREWVIYNSKWSNTYPKYWGVLNVIGMAMYSEKLKENIIGKAAIVLKKAAPNFKGNHSAADNECLHYKKQSEVIEIKTISNVSYADACKKLKTLQHLWLPMWVHVEPTFPGGVLYPKSGKYQLANIYGAIIYHLWSHPVAIIYGLVHCYRNL